MKRKGASLFFMAYGDHRIISGFEYRAQYNLGGEVAYHPFKNFDGRLIYKDGVSDKGRGQFSPKSDFIYPAQACPRRRWLVFERKNVI